MDYNFLKKFNLIFFNSLLNIEVKLLKVLILDGKINKNLLIFINKDEKWIFNLFKNYNIMLIKYVFIVLYDIEGKFKY